MTRNVACRKDCRTGTLTGRCSSLGAYDVTDHHLVDCLRAPANELARIGIGLVAGAVIKNSGYFERAPLGDEFGLLVLVVELPVKVIAWDV